MSSIKSTLFCKKLALGNKSNGNKRSIIGVKSNTSMNKEEKKSLDAYTNFYEEKKPEVKSEFPDATYGQISNMIGDMWDDLTEEEREEYRIKVSEPKRKISEKVKKPPSPYLNFCEDLRQEIKEAHPTATFSEIGKMLGDAWNSLTEEEKDAYRTDGQTNENKFSSPYLNFCEERRQGIKEAHPTATFGEIGRMLGDAWKNLSEEEKK